MRCSRSGSLTFANTGRHSGSISLAFLLLVTAIGGGCAPAARSATLDPDKLLATVEYFDQLGEGRGAPVEHREFIQVARTMVREGILPERPLLFAAVSEGDEICLGWLERGEGRSAVEAIRFDDCRPHVLEASVPVAEQDLIGTQGYAHYLLVQVAEMPDSNPPFFRGEAVRDDRGVLAGMRVCVPPGWLEEGTPMVYLEAGGRASNALQVFRVPKSSTSKAVTSELPE